jgi:hypothetical protein
LAPSSARFRNGTQIHVNAYTNRVRGKALQLNRVVAESMPPNHNSVKQGISLKLAGVSKHWFHASSTPNDEVLRTPLRVDTNLEGLTVRRESLHRDDVWPCNDQHACREEAP